MKVIAAPDGWPLWTFGVRPGREHDITAMRAHPEALLLLAEWTDDTHAALAVLGYEGERAALTTPIKHRTSHRLTADQRTVNLLHAAICAPAERGNSLLKTFEALRGSACVPGASAPSPSAPSSSCIISRAEPHDQHGGRQAFTGNGSVTDRALCPHSGSSTRIRQLIFVFRNCSSKVLCYPEYPLSVVCHTRSSTWTLRSNIVHHSWGSSQVAAHSGYTDDRFPACRSRDKIL